MPRIEQQIDLIDNVGDSKKLERYDGGLNTVDSNEILLDSELIIRQNWGNDSVGALKRVNGFTKMNSDDIASASIMGLFRAYQSDGTKQLLAVCNGTLYYSTDDGVTFAAATSGTGIATANINRGINFYDKFFFTNITNNIYCYDLGTTTMVASIDKPTDACGILLKRSDNRMIAFLNPNNASTLYYSKINANGTDANDWSKVNDAGYIAIDGSKSEPITSGLTFGSVDLIFKDYAAFKVWGYPTPSVVRIPGSPGCSAPHSAAQGEGLGFFLGHDAIWMWDGNKFIDISNPIQNELDNINPSYLANAFGVYRAGYYWLFYTASGYIANQSCLVYDITRSNPYQNRNVWYKRSGLSMNCPVVFSGSGDNNELYAGTSASTGYVYRLDYSATGADDTSNITAIFQTKYFNMGYPHLVKRFPKIHIRYYLNKGNIVVTWYTNRGNTNGSFTISPTQTGVALGSFILDTDVLGGLVEGTHTQRLPDTAVGKDISIKITHADTGTAPIIRDMEVEWEGIYVE